MNTFVTFIDTNAETGEVTEIVHYLTPEEIAQYEAEDASKLLKQPTKEELLAKLLEIQAQLQGMQ